MLYPLTLRSSPRLFSFLALLAAFLLGANAYAGTVWLNNGDRITGTIQSLDGGKLLVKTEYGGNIRVDITHVKTMASSTTTTVQSSLQPATAQ